MTAIAADYRPGDLVTWDLGNNVPHIGIVVDRKPPETGRYLVVHNIGRGPQMEDVLLRWKVTGHYRYYGPQNYLRASDHASPSSNDSSEKSVNRL